MNQLDLILENIRLGHINALLLEATTEDEIVRGVNLINESMQLLASSLLQENLTPGQKLVTAGGILGAGLGLANADTATENLQDAQDHVQFMINHVPGEAAILNKEIDILEANPSLRDAVISGNRSDYMNANLEDVANINTKVNTMANGVVGAGLGAGLGVLAARRLRR